MRLNDVELLKLLPAFMRDDGAVKGLAEGSDEVTKALAARIRLLSRWDQIDNMEHAELDEFAYELNILWYDSLASLETKRQLVKESDQVYSTLGTKWAVEQMLSAFFGDIRVREWFEYGGDPHHFMILATDPSIMGSNYTKFLYLLDIAKRKSQWLETVLVTLTGELHVYMGMITQTLAKETISMGTQVRYVNTLETYTGMIVGGLSREIVRMGDDVKFVSTIGIKTAMITGELSRETTKIVEKTGG